MAWTSDGGFRGPRALRRDGNSTDRRHRLLKAASYAGPDIRPADDPSAALKEKPQKSSVSAISRTYDTRPIPTSGYDPRRTFVTPVMAALSDAINRSIKSVRSLSLVTRSFHSPDAQKVSAWSSSSAAASLVASARADLRSGNSVP